MCVFEGFNIPTALKGWVGHAPQGRGALHINCRLGQQGADALHNNYRSGAIHNKDLRTNGRLWWSPDVPIPAKTL
jgi:hypothetical protein